MIDIAGLGGIRCLQIQMLTSNVGFTGESPHMIPLNLTGLLLGPLRTAIGGLASRSLESSRELLLAPSPPSVSGLTRVSKPPGAVGNLPQELLAAPHVP